MKTVFYSVVEEEKERNLERQDAYQEEVDKLPKGSLVIREVGGKKYHYLYYRCGSKMKSKYLKVGTNIEEIREQIARRKHYEGLIKRLKNEYKQMCKVVKDK